jgi:hypothetical protein
MSFTQVSIWLAPRTTAVQAGGGVLGPGDYGGAYVGLQGHVDVDHAELVFVAAGGPGGALTLAEGGALGGLRDDRAGPVPEDAKGSLGGDGEQLGCGTPPGPLGN